MNAETIGRALGGKQTGRGWAARCPAHEDRSPSLSICDAGDGRVLVHCHAGCDQRQVVGALKVSGLWTGAEGTDAGYNLSSPTTSRRRDVSDARTNFAPARSFDLWQPLWNAGQAASGTALQGYLASRGLQLPSDAPLRFHAACPRGSDRLPAMLALMTNPATGKPCGVHRTYLRPDGSGKADVSPAKMMLGAGGVVRLVPDADVATGLGIAEGIETSLAIMQHSGWQPVWAAGSAGAIAKFPILPGIEALTIFADRDDKGAGMAAAHECARRWFDAGREVTVQQPPAGTDWLDALGSAA